MSLFYDRLIEWNFELISHKQEIKGTRKFCRKEFCQVSWFIRSWFRLTRSSCFDGTFLSCAWSCKILADTNGTCVNSGSVEKWGASFTPAIKNNEAVSSSVVNLVRSLHSLSRPGQKDNFTSEGSRSVDSYRAGTWFSLTKLVGITHRCYTGVNAAMARTTSCTGIGLNDDERAVARCR